MIIFSDKELSKKLERAEARSNADFVETRARLDPATGAEWIDVAGAYAMFDGPESPCTQTFGLGMFDEVTADHLERIEQFFRGKGAPVLHEVSPMADPALIALLNERGYHPIEFTSVMYRGLNEMDGQPPESGVRTRVIGTEEVEMWAATSAAGWATEHEGLAEMMLEFGRVGTQCQGAFPYIAEIEGRPVATGALYIQDDVALLAGASTVPAARGKGAQGALLDARLRSAAQQGCTIAAMGALPGSISQKNAQRNGFNIAYTRTKWHLAA